MRLKKYPINSKEPYNKTTLFIKDNDYKCRHCGQEAEFIYKRASHSPFSYGYQENDEVRYLTLDHLIPRSIGGSDSFKNMQVLCDKCNNQKATSFIENDIEFFFTKFNDDSRYVKTKHHYLIEDLYYTYQISRYSFVCEVIYCYNVIKSFYPEETCFGRYVKIGNDFLEKKKRFFESKKRF